MLSYIKDFWRARKVRTVRNAEELMDAVQKAKRDDVIKIAPGCYWLSQSLDLHDTLTLIGLGADRGATRLLFSGGRALCQLAKGKTTLENLTLESMDDGAVDIRGAALSAQNCVFIGAKMGTLRGYGKFALKECQVKTNSESPAATALELRGGGVAVADACEFLGGAVLAEVVKESFFKGCRFSERADKAAISVYGPPESAAFGGTNANTTRCELVDCVVEGSKYRGVLVWQRAQAFVRGGEIRGCRAQTGSARGVEAGENSFLILEEVIFDDCDIGVGCEKNGKCNAKDVVFNNVDLEWQIAVGGDATLNGKSVKDFAPPSNSSWSASGSTGASSTVSARLFSGGASNSSWSASGSTGASSTIPASRKPASFVKKDSANGGARTPLSFVKKTTQGASVPAAPRARTPLSFVKASATPVWVPTRRVASVRKLIAAIGSAKNDETIGLAAGTYRLARSLVVSGKRLTLVGEGGSADDVRVIIVGKRNALTLRGGKVKLGNLTLESKDDAAVEFDRASALSATNCVFLGAGTAALGNGRCELTNCRVGASDAVGAAPTAVSLSLGGSLDASTCEFVGSVKLLSGAAPSALRRCSIVEAGDGCGVEVSGEFLGTVAPSCELENCRVANCKGGGVVVDFRAQAIVRGGEIRDCGKAGVRASNGASATLDGATIADCEIGVAGQTDGKCDATNVAFVNVAKEWQIRSGAVATLDGKKVKA